MGEEALPAYKPGSRPADASPCTYSLGYVRQDVYSCTQCSKGGEISGFCVGCKTACHGDHLDKVIDLYSKRYFRCDCGNTRMKNTCRLEPMKTADNPRNHKVYNHNFKGNYCRCDRVYNTKWGDMLQCAMCEDWFHEICLKATDDTPGRKMSAKIARVACELICAECCDKVPLLDDYFAKYGLFQPDVPIRQLQPAPPRNSACRRPNSVEHTALHGRDRLWPAGFRLKLCKCSECAAEYKRLNVSYITDRKDFVNLAGIPEEDLLSNAPATIQEVMKSNNNNNNNNRNKPRTPPTYKKNTPTPTPRRRNNSASSATTTIPTRSRKKIKAAVNTTTTTTPTHSSAPSTSLGTPQRKKSRKNSNNIMSNAQRVAQQQRVEEVDLDQDEDEDEDMNNRDYDYEGDAKTNMDIDGEENNNNNMVVDESETEKDSLSGCTTDEDMEDIRMKNEPLPVVELTDEERERIRSGVTAFIQDALKKQEENKNNKKKKKTNKEDEYVPDEKTLKNYLVKLKSDILNGASC